MGEEKPAVDRTSADAEHVKTSDSLKEKDVETAHEAYIPRSDEEYNVTLKTWCVVLASLTHKLEECCTDPARRYCRSHMVSASG